MTTKKLLIPTIKVYQITATGGKEARRSTTTMHVYCTSDGYPGLVITGKYSEDGIDYRGPVRIQHPHIMAGSWQEMLREFRAIITNALAEAKLIEQNDYGFWLWHE